MFDRNFSNYNSSSFSSVPTRSKSPLISSHPQKTSEKPLTFDEFMNPLRHSKPESSVQTSRPQVSKSTVSTSSFPIKNNSKVVQTNFLSTPNKGKIESITQNSSKNTSFSNVSNFSKPVNLLQFKELAKQKEMMILKRKTSATKIQALFRGFVQRKRFKGVWERFLTRKRMERLREISVRIKEFFAPFVILKALKKWVRIRRIEKARMMALFKQYSAVFIQKVWRGFAVRRKVKPVLDHKKFFRTKLKALLQGWKIRKILKSFKIQELKHTLKDLQKLEEELKQQPESHSHLQIQNQLPLLKEKLIHEVLLLYKSGNYLKHPRPSPKKPLPPMPSQKNYQTREEDPIKPLTIPPEETNQDPLPNPPKTFKNFLRRGQNTKYNPKPIAAKPKPPPSQSSHLKPESIPQIPNIPCEFSDIEADEEEDEVKIDEKVEDEFEEKTKPKHSFLKRKSQTYQPKKIEWKVATRVNCWGETIASEVKNKPSSGKRKIRKQSSFSSKVAELEEIFEALSKEHVSVLNHFGCYERLANYTVIPQITPYSSFVCTFDDESYQDAFELLQTHYLHLCNEEEVS
jgi:hypothetical protein